MTVQKSNCEYNICSSVLQNLECNLLQNKGHKKHAKH
jgi:hypothetical protein